MGTRSTARTETNMRNAIATALVTVVIAAVLAGQAQAPPWVGTWELDPVQSEYHARPAAARETMTTVPYVGAYKIAINRTDLGGRTAQTEAIARFDGTDVDRADLHVGQRLRGRHETDRWCLVRGRPCNRHASSCG
jgi:hypothetical protein